MRRRRSGGRGERDEQSPWLVYLQCYHFCSELSRKHTHTHLHACQVLRQVLRIVSPVNDVSLLVSC